MKIADFDGGTGMGVPDVDAAIFGAACRPLAKSPAIMADTPLESKEIYQAVRFRHAFRLPLRLALGQSPGGN
jgi:hypothetical protein